MRDEIQEKIAVDETSCNQLLGWMEVQVEGNAAQVNFHALKRVFSETSVVSTPKKNLQSSAAAAKSRRRYWCCRS